MRPPNKSKNCSICGDLFTDENRSYVKTNKDGSISYRRFCKKCRNEKEKVKRVKLKPLRKEPTNCKECNALLTKENTRLSSRPRADGSRSIVSTCLDCINKKRRIKKYEKSGKSDIPPLKKNKKRIPLVKENVVKEKIMPTVKKKVVIKERINLEKKLIEEYLKTHKITRCPDQKDSIPEPYDGQEMSTAWFR